MTTRLSPFGALSDRAEQRRQVGLPQHVWIDEVMPGVLITWQRAEGQWLGYVVWVASEGGAISVDWLPASRLRRAP